MTNQNNLSKQPIKFNDWVKLAYGDKDPKYYDKPKMFMPQIEWITDEAGKELVNFVGKFESLQEDFTEICNKLGKPEIQLPHLKKSTHKSYKDYYTNESYAIISDWFSEDIVRFDYEY